MSPFRCGLKSWDLFQLGVHFFFVLQSLEEADLHLRLFAHDGGLVCLGYP